MRKALIVGIDHYRSCPLSGCVNDANAMGDLLSRHEDGSPNFNCRKLLTPNDNITRPVLREQLTEVFAGEPEVALFYYSGHGCLSDLGGYIVTQDVEKYDEGIRQQELLDITTNSKAHEIVIILDCCFSGSFGQIPVMQQQATLLRQGMSVLTASSARETAQEIRGHGVFTSLVQSALQGGAADVIGNVTIASLYAYVDQLLGPWDQRPQFMSRVSRLSVLRRCMPQIELETLRLLRQYFSSPDSEFPLDPSFEPDEEPHDLDHERIFSHLQRFRAARLLEPVGEEHMYFAALNRKYCKLTPTGQFYWNMIDRGLL